MGGEAQVTDVEVERERGVTVRFADGNSCRFTLEELRQNCPCAACRGERERGRPPWPAGDRLQVVPELRIADAELVGAWGLGITWADGHRTGIYPWDSLRDWCEARDR